MAELIKREDVLQTISEQYSIGVDYEILEGLINQIPSVEEHKQGEWIRKPIRNEEGGCIGAEMICSCCNKDNEHDEYMDFCPKCGADMRGSKNEQLQ